MTDRLDSLMLGWLAREARFLCNVQINDTTGLGYYVTTRVTLTRREEPVFMEWMEMTHGITARFIYNKGIIQKVVDLLWPIRELVFDRESMELMQHLLRDAPHRWTYDTVVSLVMEMDRLRYPLSYTPPNPHGIDGTTLAGEVPAPDD